MAENRPAPYAIVIERAGDGYPAHVSDLPGRVATGATIADVRRGTAGAVRVRIEGLRADGEPVPAPTIPGGPPCDPPCDPSLADADDPFAAFTEWAGGIDEAAYADL